MQIVLIDDNEDHLNTLAQLLRRMGHQVRDFTNPWRALANLPKDTDVVVSDIIMPALDGFSVAERVAAVLGNHLPRVLLFSGDNYQAALQTYPPSVVIGILSKPIRHADLSRVMSLLEQTRTRCPGTLNIACPYALPLQEASDASAQASSPCYTSKYAVCPHYDKECGKTLRSTVKSSHEL